MGRDLVLGFSFASDSQLGVATSAAVGVGDLLGSGHYLSTLGLRGQLGRAHFGAFATPR